MVFFLFTFDVLKGSRYVGIVHEQIGRGRPQPVESEIRPLDLGGRGEVGDAREVDDLQFEETLVEYEGGEELRLVR